MAAGCIVTALWKRSMIVLPLALLMAAQDGMWIGMRNAERVARNRARWQKDGTDTSKWYVTGTARHALLGYVHIPQCDPPYAAFDEHDPRYGSWHFSPELDSLDPISAPADHVVGVLTMTEQHTPALQSYEISHFGNTVTREALRAAEASVWAAIKVEVNKRVRLL